MGNGRSFNNNERKSASMETVIIGKGGERYHEEFCPYVLRIDKKSRKEVTIREAERRGYHACKFCCSVKGIAYNNRINYGWNCYLIGKGGLARQ